MKKRIVTLFLVLMTLLSVSSCSFFAGDEKNMNKRLFKKISDNYQGDAETNWHLYIGNYQDYEYYFVLYDNSGMTYADEKHWISGPVLEVTKKTITIDADTDLFYSFDSEWVMDGDTLIVGYELEDDRITISNNGNSISFLRQEAITNPNINGIP